VAEKQMVAAVVETKPGLRVVGPCRVTIARDSIADVQSPLSCTAISFNPSR
jgi:hypothetical protein